jgi:hypothetical protein
MQRKNNGRLLIKNWQRKRYGYDRVLRLVVLEMRGEYGSWKECVLSAENDVL